MMERLHSTQYEYFLADSGSPVRGMVVSQSLTW